jgi:hypothetical protein
MAAKIKLIFVGKRRSFLEPLIGRIVLGGNHGIGADGEHFLSTDCASAIELEAEANSLKSQLDEIVRTAKRKFPA